MTITSTRFSVICVILFTGVASGAPNALMNEGYKRFDGQKVYRAIATTEEQLKVLRTIEEQSIDGVLFWTPAGAPNVPVDVMVSPKQETEILSAFEASGISYETFIDNVQFLMDTENPEINRSLRVDEAISMNWTAYHRLETIYAWLEELRETYPEWVEVIDAGYSYEGRVVKGVKIIFDEDNPGIFLEGGFHAREWISPAVVTYVTNEVLTSTDVVFNFHARAHNWYIFPVGNPDGYEYTHTTDRTWRKTRKPYDNDCVGADPNRNFDFYWLTTGASNNSCSSTYAGPEPFSESEVKAVADYITSVSDKFYIYLSIHSYSQLYLSAYGHTTDRVSNYDDVMTIGNKAAEALARRYGTQFIVGSAAEAIYVNSGNSIDWVRGVHNTPVVYCVELRDTGTYGFLLPADQIIPSALEFIDSLIAVIGESGNLGYPEIHTGAVDEVEF